MSNINAKFTMPLSLEGIEGYKNFLENYKKQLPQIAVNIVKEVSEIGLKDNYQSTELIPVKNKGGTITGGIRTTDEKDTYREFGTGIVGSNNPHVSEILAQIGWKYDINEHGEKGWVYPKSDGSFGWTKGLVAEKKFYNATKKMEDSFQAIAIKEFKKLNK